MWQAVHLVEQWAEEQDGDGEEGPDEDRDPVGAEGANSHEADITPPEAEHDAAADTVESADPDAADPKPAEGVDPNAAGGAGFDAAVGKDPDTGEGGGQAAEQGVDTNATSPQPADVVEPPAAVDAADRMPPPEFVEDKGPAAAGSRMVDPEEGAVPDTPEEAAGNATSGAPCTCRRLIQ